MSGIVEIDNHRPLTGFHPVIDLASGETAGWEVLARSRDRDLIGLALAARGTVRTGCFVSVRLPAREIEDAFVRRRLSDARRLDGLALILCGELNRDGRCLLEDARERGALVGCDTAAALVHFTALGPDLLSLPEPGAAAGHDPAATGAVAVLAAMAARVGARVIAHDVTTPSVAAALGGLGVALGQGTAFGLPSPRLPAARGSPNRPRLARAGWPWTKLLEETLPCLPAASSIAAIIDLCLDDEGHEWVVLVDDRSRPVRLVERAALVRGEPFEQRAIPVLPAMPLEGVAQAAVDRPVGSRSRPLVLCDAAGRYRGLLMPAALPAQG